MCFSAQADLVGGIVVGAIGVDACRHLRGRNDHLMLAGLPLLLGAHQLDEAFVWWGIHGASRARSVERRCGSTSSSRALLFSGYRHIEIFGVVNLVAVAVLAWLTMDGFASLWCGYATVAAGAIALHMRYARPHRT